MTIGERKNRKGDKIYFHFDTGKRGKGGRIFTGIYIYTSPENRIERNFNKEALALLEVKKSEYTLERLAIGSSYIPLHKLKVNFLDFYQEYVKSHSTTANRHLNCSLSHFKAFTGRSFIPPVDITEDLCKQFNKYLLQRLHGDTPSNYFSRFKEVAKAATKAGYYRNNPAESIAAQSNPVVRIKDNLEVEEYLSLLNTPCPDPEVKFGFIFCCYTALRYCDVNVLDWEHITANTLCTRILQKKTGKPVILTLHPIAQAILDKRMDNISGKEKVFSLPSLDSCNNELEKWMIAAKINKKITWSCARLSFSILLQDKNVDHATVAYLLGHTTTNQVRKTYKRHRPKDQTATIGNLPMPSENPYFLTF